MNGQLLDNFFYIEEKEINGSADIVMNITQIPQLDIDKIGTQEVL